MPNNQSHDPRTENPANRVAQAVGLSVASVAQTPAAVLFQDSFDDQPDWTSTMHSTQRDQDIVQGDTIPEGWWGIYQDTTWSPETGHPTKHASLEILSANSDKARGGTGKSAVFWRESYSFDNNFTWASDAQFVKVLDEDQTEVYIEFYIRFSENWWQRGKTADQITTDFPDFISKMFRMGHWSRERFMWNGASGEIGPRFIWQYKVDPFGLRSFFTYEDGPPSMSSGLGDDSRNYTGHMKGQEVGGTDPQLFDQDPNGPGGLLCDFNQLVLHENVFGPASQWTKVGFYVKLNSAPGVADGKHYHWINGHRVMAKDNIPWVDSNAQTMPGWNFFAIGGNDFFRPFPDTDQFEDWWALDDIKVENRLPEALQ